MISYRKRYGTKLAAIMCCFLLFQLFFASFASFASADGTSATETMKLYPTDDAYVRGGIHAETNFGAETDLIVKRVPTIANDNREAYLKFDLSQIPGQVADARFFFYGAVTDTNGTDYDLKLYRAEEDQWTEGALTWSNKPAKGAEIAPAVGMNKTRQWRSYDITSYIGEQRLGDQVASLVLAQEGNGLIMKIDSRERPNQPYLEVAYTQAQDLPPVWPEAAALDIALEGPASVRLQWTPAFHPAGIAGYRIYQDGDLIQTVTESVYDYQVSNLVPGAAYIFRIEAGSIQGVWSLNGPQGTVAITAEEPSELLLTPTDDTFVRAGASYEGANYGGLTTLDIKLGAGDLMREAFIKFDLASVTGEIDSAILSLYGGVTDGGGTDVDNQLYSTGPQWQEATATWNTKPAFLDHLGVFYTNKTKKWIEIDVTAYLKQQLRGETPSYASFGIRQEGSKGLMMKLNTKEAEEFKPYLKIISGESGRQAPVWASGTELYFTDLHETGVTINWPSAQDNDGIAGYRVYQNGVLLDTVMDNRYSVNGLSIGQSYTYRVEAGDTLGNWSTDGPFKTAQLSETRLEQVKNGNVFLGNEPVAFKIVTSRSSVAWSVKDLWGTEVASGETAGADGAVNLTIPMNRFGYFVLEAQAQSAGLDPVTLTTSFAVFEPYDFRAVEDSPFGINSHFARPNEGWTLELMDLIEMAGFKNVRESIGWSRTERTKGVYQVAPADETNIAEITNRGMNPFMLLAYENANYDNASTPYTDEGRQGFANYGKFLMGYFGDRIKAFEIYNEFNIGFGDRGTGPADSRPDYYYPLLKTTYETMKTADPDKILAGMTTSNVPIPWMEEVFKLGGMNNLDVITVHPYQFPKNPENLVKDLDKLKDLIRKYNNGELKPIWLTEIGYPTHAVAAGVNEKVQADYLVRTFVVALANGVGKVFWYDLMNDGVNATNLEHNYGIIYNAKDERGKHTPKPAYASMGAMARQLTGAEFAADESTDDGIRNYRFTKEQEDIRVVWAEGKVLPVAIHSVSPVRIVDIMGNEKTYYPRDGKIYYTLTDETIYVLGDIGQIASDETIVLSGERAVVGNDAELVLKIQNDGTTPFEGTFTLKGQSYPVQAAPGAHTSVPIALPGLQKEGILTVTGELVSAGGQRMGHLTALVPFSKPYEVKVRPVFTADGSGKELKVMITNYSVHNQLVLDGMSWTVGALAGETTEAVVIAPSSEWTVVIPLTGLENHVDYPAAVTIQLQGYDPVYIESKANFTPVYHKSEADQPVTLDWSMGVSKVTNYTGPEDLGGTVTLNWDEDNFYMSADIVDDVFSYNAVEKDMYTNDGFQFGIAPGIPGESAEWYDMGFSQTPAGGQIFSWITPNGVEAGLIRNGDLKIVRNEENKITRYELTLPWSELSPVVPADGVFSFSLLLNENDGDGRNGYWEWGSGIGGAKDPKKYRTVQLVPPSSIPSAEQARLSGPSSVEAEETFTLTYGLQDVSSQVYAHSLTLGYNPELLRYVPGSAKSLVENFAVVGETVEPGRLQVLQAGTSAGRFATGTVELLTLEFQALTPLQSETALVILSEAIVADQSGEETWLTADSSYQVEIVVNTVNKAELNTLIAAAETAWSLAKPLDPGHPRYGYYPQAALDALQAAIEAAKTVRDNQGASQAAVDSAVAQLGAALEAFGGQMNTARASVGDLAPISAHYGLAAEGAGWASLRLYDLNGDGVLDFVDLAAMAMKILQP